jgi:hypothetical protein
MSCFNLYASSSSVQTNNIFYLIIRKISNILVHVFIVTLIFPQVRERKIVQLVENLSSFYFAFTTC